MKYLKYTPLLISICLALTTSAYGQKIANNVLLIEGKANVYAIALSNFPAKQALNRRFAYTQEVRRASQLYYRINHTHESEPTFGKLRHDIQNNIVNRTLQKNMLAHLDQGNKLSMLNDLAEYYHLSPKYLSSFDSSPHAEETFVLDTLRYIRKHPHKPSWALRQVLKTPGVDESLKAQIRELLKQNEVSAEETNTYVNVLRQAYQQYLEAVEQAEKDPYVLATLKIYKQLGEEMAVFTSLNKRSPRWGEENERDLYNRFETLLYHNQVNQFEAIIPYIERLYMFAESFPAPRIDEDLTLKYLKGFWQKHGRLPQSVYLRDFLTQLPDEALLYEEMLYWRQHSPAFQDAINELTIPKTDNFYPPYY